MKRRAMFAFSTFVHFEDFQNEIVFSFFPTFFFFNCKKQLQNFFLSQHFHLYLPRPGVLLTLAGRFKFGGGGGSETLSSLGSFLCEAGDYRKETWERGQLSFALRR